MAEINIKRKKKPIWPWLLALVVVVGIIWILAEMYNNPESRELEQEDNTTIGNKPIIENDTVPAIAGTEGNEFARFVSEHEAPTVDSLQRGYIMEGMDHLSATLGNVVDQKFINNPEVNEKRSKLTNKIDQLKADTAIQTLPEHVKEAFVAAATLMAALQEGTYPDLDSTVSDLKEIAASIEPASADSLKRNVQAFFEKSSKLTLAMTDSTSYNF